MDKMEYMGNMSVDIMDKTEHVRKTSNTDLNKSHDVESTLGNISVDILDETEHVDITCTQT